MKRVLKPLVFYISYFGLSFLSVLLLTTGFRHPNLSVFSREYVDWLTSLIGDLGIFLFFFFFAWLVFKSTRRRINFLTTVSIIFSVICLGVAAFANVFSLGFSFVQLDSFQNPTQIKFILYYAKYVINFIINPPQIYYFIPIIAILIIRRLTDTSLHQHFSIYIKLISLLLTLVLIVFPFLSYEQNRKGTIFEYTLNPLYASSKVGVINYYFYDLYSYLAGKDSPMTDLEKQQIEEYLQKYEGDCFVNFIDNNNYCKTNSYTNLANGKNLVIIQVEALNEFVVDLKVNGVEITPNLNRLKQESLYFNNFYSSAGIGNTSDTEFSTMTSLYGNGNELTIIASHGENYHTLAKDFKQKDYYTFSLHGNIGEFYNRKEKHIKTLGFDRHYDKWDFIERSDKELNLVHDWINDKDFLSISVDIFEEIDKPFFAYPITVVSHAPYVPSKEVPANKLNLGKSITNLSRNYLEHIHYFDEALGIFLNKMEASGLLDNTVIVIHGDHTSSLFKKDIEGILDKKLTDIEYRQIMQKVPCLIYAKGLIYPGIDSSVHSTVDLYPTMANLFGLDYQYRFGVDMLSDEPTYVYSPRSLDIFFDDFIYIYPTKKVIKLKNNINDEKITQLIQHFEYQKRMNDLILNKKYFA